jgi:hypothetical protein
MTATAGSLVCPVRDDLARYNQFMVSLMALRKPEGSRLTLVTGMSPSASINRYIRNEMHGDWLMLLGDDHVFAPDTLERLLAHDVDVVVPLCFTRRAPFFWTIFRDETTDENGLRRWVTYEPDEVPESGLFPVYAAGAAGMVIRRHVLDAIGDPWLENQDTIHASEDVMLCSKIREAGFRIHVDLDVHMGHIGSIVTNPAFKPDEGWGCLVEFAGSPSSVFLPGTDQRRTWLAARGESGGNGWRPVGVDGHLRSKRVTA